MTRRYRRPPSGMENAFDPEFLESELLAALTAETITDTEIRELQLSTHEDETVQGDALWRDCRVALGGGYVELIGSVETTDPEAVRSARARCAEIWDARHAKDGES